MHSILMRSSFALVIAISVRQSVTAYVPIISSAVSSSPHTTSSRLQLVDRDDDENEGTIEEKTFRIPNPLAELGDILSNWDDVVDDFFNKRMGNGEVFYGKRKYKPSGRVDSDYNGGGFSDWRKMEAAREFREERAMMRALRGEKNINEKNEDGR